MLTRDIINQLTSQEQKKKLSTWEYLDDLNNENFKYVADKFFKKETDEKKRTLNVWSGVFETITWVYSSFVGNPLFPVNINLKLAVDDFVTFGYACLSVERVDNEWSVVCLPTESHIRLEWVDYIYRAYKKIVDNKTQYYYLETSYNGGTITNTLYRADGILTAFKQVPLDTVEETRWLQDVIATGLDQCFWKVYNADDQVSIIDKIKKLVYSLDRKAVMFDTQFLQNVESFVLVKGIDLPNSVKKSYSEWNPVDFASLGRYITTTADGGMEFVENTNNLIKDAMWYEQTQLKKISSITWVPIDYLWWDGTAWAIWEWSRQLLHWLLIKRITEIRSIFDTVLQEILNSLTWVVDQYTRPDIYPTDSKDILDEVTVALNSWIISRHTAMRRYLDLTDEEVEIEKQRIDSEIIPNQQ